MLVGVTPTILRPATVVATASSWNPTDNSVHNTLSNQNRTAKKTGDSNRYSAVRSTAGRASGAPGVFQFEVRIDVEASPFIIVVGLVPITQPLGDGGNPGIYPGDRNPGYGYEGDGFIYYNGQNQGGLLTFRAGDVIGVALTSSVVQFYRNGTFARQQSESSGTTFFPVVATYISGDQATLNTGQTAFDFPISGAAPWG